MSWSQRATLADALRLALAVAVCVAFTMSAKDCGRDCAELCASKGYSAGRPAQLGEVCECGGERAPGAVVP